MTGKVSNIERIHVDLNVLLFGHTIPILKVSCIVSPSRNTLLCGSVEI